MSINRTPKGWRVEIDRKGIRRVRKLFGTERDARQFERKYLEVSRLLEDVAFIEQALIDRGEIPGKDFRTIDLLNLAMDINRPCSDG